MISDTCVHQLHSDLQIYTVCQLQALHSGKHCLMDVAAHENRRCSGVVTGVGRRLPLGYSRFQAFPSMICDGMQ